MREFTPSAERPYASKSSTSSSYLGILTGISFLASQAARHSTRFRRWFWALELHRSERIKNLLRGNGCFGGGRAAQQSFHTQVLVQVGPMDDFGEIGSPTIRIAPTSTCAETPRCPRARLRAIRA